MIKIKELSADAQSAVKRIKERHGIKTNSKAVVKILEEFEYLHRLIDGERQQQKEGCE